MNARRPSSTCPCLAGRGPLAPPLPRQGFSSSRRSTGAGSRTSGPTGAATGRSGSSWSLFVLTLFAEFIANDRPIWSQLQGRVAVPGRVDYPEEKFGGFLAAHRLPRPGDRQGDRRQRLDALAADPLLLQHPQPRPAGARPRAADLAALGRAVPRRIAERSGGDGLPRHRMELARHRRPGPRRGRAADLRLPHLGAVRADPRRRSPR